MNFDAMDVYGLIVIIISITVAISGTLIRKSVETNREKNDLIMRLQREAQVLKRERLLTDAAVKRARNCKL